MCHISLIYYCWFIIPYHHLNILLAKPLKNKKDISYKFLSFSENFNGIDRKIAVIVDDIFIS